MKNIWVGALFLFLLLAAVAQGAIIGTDDRKEVYEVRDPRLREVALSSAILLHKSRGYLIPYGQGYRLAPRVKTHEQAEHLCKDQRFRSEPVPGYCSAFLVAPDRIATVAHCIAPELSNMQVVFDFASLRPGEVTREFTKDQVFEVTRVVAKGQNQDWAILALDRPVPGRTPMQLHEKGMAQVGAPLAAIGYPSGLPLKVSDNAPILEPVGADEDVYLEANLDVFAGSSGSAAVNLRTYEVEGIVAVAFGEHESGIEDGKPCVRMRRITDPAEEAPVWVVRASLLPSVF